MTLDRFTQLADIFGADIGRWPEEERDAARRLATTDAGAQAIKAIKGDLVSVHVIARPHSDVEAVLPKKK